MPYREHALPRPGSSAAFVLAVLAVTVLPAGARNTDALVTARGRHLRFEIFAPGVTEATEPALRLFYRDPRTVVRTDVPNFRRDRWVASPPVPSVTTEATFAVDFPAGGSPTWVGRYRAIPSKQRVPLMVDSPDGTFRARVPPEIAGPARLFVVGTAYVPPGVIPSGYEAVSEPWRFTIGHLPKAQRGAVLRFEYLAPLDDDGDADPRLAAGIVVVFTDLGGTWHSVPTTYNPAVGAAGFDGQLNATYIAAVPVP